MNFEWDDEKSDDCLKSRGFSFDFAAGIFNRRPVLRYVDDRPEMDYQSEVRIWAVGRIDDDRVFVVVYTDRQGLSGRVRRIISARRAKTRERAEWLWFKSQRPRPALPLSLFQNRLRRQQKPTSASK